MAPNRKAPGPGGDRGGALAAARSGRRRFLARARFLCGAGPGAVEAASAPAPAGPASPVARARGRTHRIRLTNTVPTAKKDDQQGRSGTCPGRRSWFMRRTTSSKRPWQRSSLARTRRCLKRPSRPTVNRPGRDVALMWPVTLTPSMLRREGSDRQGERRRGGGRSSTRRVRGGKSG